jgi:hypothetical protein
MGDINHRRFIQRYRADLAGPYLEVGSKDYGNTVDLRSLFAGGDDYVGVDLEDGPGVDALLDLAEPFDQIDTRLQGKRFGTIFCLSVLEHCRQPFVMAENLTRLLEPAGKICVAVPFAFRYHAYPGDYWRFTHEGVKRLFPRLTFDPEHCAWATSRRNDFRAVDEQVGKIPFGFKSHWKQGHLLRGVTGKILRLLPKIGVLGWLSGYRYVLAPTNLLMIGEFVEG